MRRNGRLHKHYKKNDEQNTDQNSQVSVNTEDDEQDTCDEQVRLNQQYISYPVFYEQTEKCNIPVVSDNISCVCEPTNSTIKVISKYSLTADKLNLLRLSGYNSGARKNFLKLAMTMVTVIIIYRFLNRFRLFKFKWIGYLLFVVAKTGGIWVSKIFSATLSTIWKRIVYKQQQCNTHVAMPASTRIITAREINSKLKDFEKRVSLVDTGTDAYLRQDDGLMCPTFPSSTVINTAGPDQLRASKSGLLNLLVKDEKGNMHQIMLENALVVPGLSQNPRHINSLLKMDIWYSFTKLIRNSTK